MIGLRSPRIGDNTHQIRTRTCHIGDGQLTGSRNSLKSQLLMMISPISSDLSLSCAQLYHHLVLATGPGNPPAVRVRTGKTVRFGSRTVQKPDPQHLVNPRVLPGLARPVGSNLRFCVSGFSIYGRI
jgi:hypothetical protein